MQRQWYRPRLGPAGARRSAPVSVTWRGSCRRITASAGSCPNRIVNAYVCAHARMYGGDFGLLDTRNALALAGQHRCGRGAWVSLQRRSDPSLPMCGGSAGLILPGMGASCSPACSSRTPSDAGSARSCLVCKKKHLRIKGERGGRGCSFIWTLTVGPRQLLAVPAELCSCVWPRSTVCCCLCA